MLTELTPRQSSEQIRRNPLLQLGILFLSLLFSLLPFFPRHLIRNVLWSALAKEKEASKGEREKDKDNLQA